MSTPIQNSHAAATTNNAGSSIKAESPGGQQVRLLVAARCERGLPASCHLAERDPHPASAQLCSPEGRTPITDNRSKNGCAVLRSQLLTLYAGTNVNGMYARLKTSKDKCETITTTRHKTGGYALHNDDENHQNDGEPRGVNDGNGQAQQTAAKSFCAAKQVSDLIVL